MRGPRSPPVGARQETWRPRLAEGASPLWPASRAPPSVPARLFRGARWAGPEASPEGGPLCFGPLLAKTLPKTRQKLFGSGAESSARTPEPPLPPRSPPLRLRGSRWDEKGVAGESDCWKDGDSPHLRRPEAHVRMVGKERTSVQQVGRSTRKTSQVSRGKALRNQKRLCPPENLVGL